MNFCRLIATGPAALFAVSVCLMESAPVQAAEISAPRYLIQNIGRMPGVKGVGGWDINNAGMVTGTFSTYGRGSPTLAFLWSDGHMQNVVPPDSGVTYAQTFKLNNLGDAVGYVSYGNSSGGRATIFRPGQLIDLTSALGGSGGAFAINDVGQVAGTVSVESGQRNFLLDKSGVQLIEGHWMGSAQVLDMNNAGTLLVNASKDGKSVQGVLYRDGAVTELGPVDDFQSFTAINHAGQVVGTRDGHAFVHSDGAFNFLPTPEGFATRAADINSQGWVIGQMRSLTAPWQGSNFLYRDGQLHGFEDLLLPFNAAHWSDLEVRAMNDKGQIMGIGTFNGKYIRTFVATPIPEPETNALLLAGLGVVGWIAHRRKAAVQLNMAQ